MFCWFQQVASPIRTNVTFTVYIIFHALSSTANCCTYNKLVWIRASPDTLLQLVSLKEHRASYIERSHFEHRCSIQQKLRNFYPVPQLFCDSLCIKQTDISSCGYFLCTFACATQAPFRYWAAFPIESQLMTEMFLDHRILHKIASGTLSKYAHAHIGGPQARKQYLNMPGVLRSTKYTGRTPLAALPKTAHLLPEDFHTLLDAIIVVQ